MVMYIEATTTACKAPTEVLFELTSNFPGVPYRHDAE